MKETFFYRFLIVGCVVFFAFSLLSFVDFGKDPAFALGSPTWTTSTPFTGVSSPTSTPVIFDGSNFVIAFAQSGGSATNIYISTSTDGTSWSSTTTVITSDAAGGVVLDLAYFSTTSEYGLVYAYNENDIRFVSSTNLTTWSDPVTVVTGDLLGGTTARASLAYSITGVRGIAYTCKVSSGDCGSTTSSIGFATSSDGSSWATSTAKVSSGSEAGLVGFAFYGEEARLAWIDQGSPINAFFSTSSNYGGTWSSDVSISGDMVFATDNASDFAVTSDGVNLFQYVHIIAGESFPFLPVATVRFATSSNGVVWNTSILSSFGITGGDGEDRGMTGSVVIISGTYYTFFNSSLIPDETQMNVGVYSGGAWASSTLEYGYTPSAVFVHTGLASDNSCRIVGAYSVPSRNGELMIASAQDGACSSGVTIPMAPTNFVTSTVSSTYASFTWDDNSDDEDKFIFDYIASSDIANFPGTIDDIDANATAATTPGLTPNQVYTFRIAAVNTAGTSTYATTTFYTNAVEPSAITASASGQSSVIVSWTDDTNASGSTYQISYADGTTVDTTTNKSYTVSGLSAGASYSFKVRTRHAGDATVYSDYTSSASATTDAASSSGGGGGGGSPAPVAPSAPVTSAPVVTVKTVTANKPQVIKVGNVSHTVTAKGAAINGKVSFLIESDPVTVVLAAGEDVVIDTDSNGTVDLYIALHSIINDTTFELELAAVEDMEFVINQAQSHTTTRDVLLSFNSPESVLVAISNESTFAKAGYESYAKTKKWKLSEGNGVKTVYAKLRTAQGGERIVSDSITLTSQTTDATLPTTQSCPLPLNKPYKSPASSAVYYVSEAHYSNGSVDTSIPCAKRPFTSSQKFFTYFTNWNQVVPTTAQILNSIPLDTLGFMPEGPLYNPQYGALVKIVADPKVYLLLGGSKYWITSEAVFTGLKYSWSWIEGVADELLDKYTTKEEITYTDHHPNYTLVKYQNNPKVYRLESHPTDTTKQVKRHITDEATFNALNFRWDRIVTIDESEVYETGAPLTTPSKTTAPAPTNSASSSSQPQTSFTSFLTLGSGGSEVLLLQNTLQSLGFFPSNITPNGNFGPATEAAVKAFQIAHALDPLGYVGPRTREVLNGLL